MKRQNKRYKIKRHPTIAVTMFIPNKSGKKL